MPDVEEARAIEFRRQQAARATYRANMHTNGLLSDTVAVLAFRAAWLPLLDRQREWDPADLGLEESGRGLQVP